jgi:hypothetical protein
MHAVTVTACLLNGSRTMRGIEFWCSIYQTVKPNYAKAILHNIWVKVYRDFGLSRSIEVILLDDFLEYGI